MVSTLLLTGCGSTHSMNKSFDTAMVSNSAQEFYTGGDYSSTNIDSDKADYSYTFRASGETKRSKSEILSDYETLQKSIQEKDGYVSNCNNSYNYYNDSSDTRYGDGIENVSYGCVQFSAEVPNDQVPSLLEELEALCKDYKFTVNTYRQNIVNYEKYEIVDHESDDDYWHERITEDELNRRLQYATVDVSLNYYTKRPAITTLCYRVRNAFLDVYEGMQDYIQILIIVLIFGVVTSLVVNWRYRRFKRMQYKFRQKHPEYFERSMNVTLSDKKSEEQEET